MNVKLLKHSLKRGLLYEGLTLGAGVFLTFYLKVILPEQGMFSAPSFFHTLSNLVFLLGAAYSFIFMATGFSTSFFTEVAYGGTRKDSLQYMISSIGTCSFFSLALSFLFRVIGAKLGSGDSITLQFFFLCLNIVLLVLALGFSGGLAVAKFGKPAYYGVTFVMLGGITGTTLSSLQSLSQKGVFDWTDLSETFLGQPLMVAISMVLLTCTVLLVSQWTKRMDVKI